jgi:hypothetical protein
MCAASEAGVSNEFAQIFLRDNNDLTGRQSEDPKNPYVTGIFGACHILKCFAGLTARKIKCCVEIPRDSNTLDRTTWQK